MDDWLEESSQAAIDRISEMDCVAHYSWLAYFILGASCIFRSAPGGCCLYAPLDSLRGDVM